ncbi:MAG: phosphopantothenoylcysteine decarboxylase [Candidatus Omnitrophota bacterium]|nr:phosphopantothenoylcysteine decarboxylase [Candidatus Omnitrophota bacterium]
MLKNKRILITAGPTWVPIDKVRVISNIATGQTGILLAEELRKQGAKVTLLLGPAESCCLNKKIKLIRFHFFSELKNLIIKELKTKKYDSVIHSAAVSDYKPSKVYPSKIKSGIINLRLNLVPTEKIIGLIKRIDSSIILVGFKFEPQAGKALLIKRSKALILGANLDLAVANTVNKNKYSAYILDNYNRSYGPVFNKKVLVKKLTDLIGGDLWKN